jgi:predicted NAD/FAD-binding protein
MPFEAWARARGYEEVAELVRPWFTGFGYGYLHEIPAAYVLKYMTIGGLPLSALLEGGFQALWERVARPLDVRLGADIRRITRDASGVTVETADGGAHVFDRLVLACPLDRALSFLDASAEERRLFAEIRYVDYRVVAAYADGPLTSIHTFTTELGPERRGEPIFWYRRWKDSGLHTFYAIGGPEIDDARVVGGVERTLSRLGARMGKVVRTLRWEYFPHVTPAAMAAGFYPAIEAIQGVQRTYYAGELLCFPTVETVVGYSFDLAQRFFAPAALSVPERVRA